MGLGLALVLWILAPVGGFVFLTLRVAATEVAPARATWAPISASDGMVSSDAALLLQWSPAPTLVAPAWDGIVQRVYVSPGESLESGSFLAQIGGVKRIAFTSTIPFSRPLQQGDSGEDVEQLHALLQSLVIDNPGGSRFTYGTAVATAVLAKQLGAQVAWTAAFDPGWVVYLPAPMTVQSVELPVGSPAPGGGQTIAEGRDELSGAIVVTSTLLESVSDADEFDIERDLDEADRLTLDETQRLMVGERELEVDDSRQVVATASLADLAPLVQSGAIGVPARLVAASARGEWAVLRQRS